MNRGEILKKKTNQTLSSPQASGHTTGSKSVILAKEETNSSEQLKRETGGRTEYI